MDSILSALVGCMVLTTVFSQLQECYVAPQPRACEGYVDTERWFFNSTTGQCKSFEDFQTCTTGDNSFNSFSECQHACVCQLEAQPVACGGGTLAFESPYYFSKDTNKCELFPTENGQCSLNGNYFRSESSCKMTCVCSLPVEQGTGSEALSSYFYNGQTQGCEAFQYTGEGGNANRFDTKTDCLDQCLCGLPRKPSAGEPTCLAFIPSYFYNRTSEECEYFIYGGCGGNNNRFGSQEACEDSCGDFV